MHLFQMGESDAVIELLLAWVKSYQEATMGQEFDPIRELEYAKLYKADPKLGNHLVVGFRSKETRDNTVCQLVYSPECKAMDPTSCISAKLTLS